MAKALLLLCLTICQANFLFGDTIDPQEEKQYMYRLPTDVVPSSYALSLEPNLDNFTFTGSVDIAIEVKVEVNNITLNQKNLNIKSVNLKNLDGKTNDVKVKIDDLAEEEELLIIKPENDVIKKGNYILTINYSAELNDQKRGFYRSRYIDKNNNIKYVAATHFEPTGARLAFPCWDEPDFKATFNISITHSKSYKAISNMKNKSITIENEKVVSKFDTTPKMSTYLVAFVVSDYESSNRTENDIEFKVWTKPHAVKQTEYALNVSVYLMKELDDYMEIPYSDEIKKMDQVSLKDFSAGAMENWGLVTYRESSLLVKNNVTSDRSIQGVTTTIAHEFTHQWFGNLVSPKWWKYIWLNEGFADYFQYFITHKILPDWRLDEVFVVDNTQGVAFVTDAGTNTRPMNQDATTPAEISKLFDNIAYQKSGAVIRMMSHILGLENFQKGLREYLNKMKYKNANSSDLFKYLDKNGKENLPKNVTFEQLMDEWVNKPGYPVVNVVRKEKVYEISQKRFLLYKSGNDTKWWVPLTYFRLSNINETTLPKLWLSPNDEFVKVDVKEGDGIIFNALQTGYYRVNYDKENWKLLNDYLNSSNYTKLSPITRAQLIDDALNLARVNQLSYDVALNLTLYLHKEVDYMPWQTTFRNLNFLNIMMRASEHYQMFNTYVTWLMRSLVEKMDYKPKSNDDHFTKILRPTIMYWGCRAGVENCVDYVNNEFNEWLNDSKKELDANLKNNILCAGLRNSDSEAWDRTWNVVKNIMDEDERNNLSPILACSSSSEVLEKYLLQTLETNSSLSFSTVYRNIINEHPMGVDIVLKVLNDKYKSLNKTEHNLKSYLDIIANSVTTKEQLEKLLNLIWKEGLQDNQANMMLKANSNIDWLEHNKKSIEEWLHERNSSSGLVAFASMIILSIFVTRFY
ncbi:aminopeptidase N-like [Apis dorsata]|uniref:aminopeptidase N-like n=1 Tax=Apis dorsata TaxID=7462 RepID=UPI001292DB17|nr:aminopeptidase N-like [Apis dorsata]XP_031367796.1 aminopeptidase N-like [Apis dorsata]